MTLTILSLEDEADVRDALERDLEEFWDKIRLEVAEDVDDAWAVIDEIVEDGDELALVLSDHRLPGKSGVGCEIAGLPGANFGVSSQRAGPRRTHTMSDTELCPKRRPLRPQHPIFAVIRRGGLHFGHHTSLRSSFTTTKRGELHH